MFTAKEMDTLRQRSSAKWIINERHVRQALRCFVLQERQQFTMVELVQEALYVIRTQKTTKNCVRIGRFVTAKLQAYACYMLGSLTHNSVRDDYVRACDVLHSVTIQLQLTNSLHVHVYGFAACKTSYPGIYIYNIFTFDMCDSRM